MSSPPVFEAVLPTTKRILLVHGDITGEAVDAIVNAANEHLAHGGGVAGAIVRSGGPSIQEESDRLAPVPTGDAVRTGAGTLPAKAVIHAVGPRMGQGDEDRLLLAAMRSALRVASQAGDRVISCPAISSGIFGFPKDRCAAILVGEAQRFLENEETSLEDVRFCLIDQPTVEVFLREMQRRFSD
ncbi:MAG: macro domain-containing protein [Planctomycetes bacterium]|nr:macro domain-containing protein [Planctomycetota bacterium]